jgi:predicted acyltransferase
VTTEAPITSAPATFARPTLHDIVQSTPPVSMTPQRLISLDIFRGITIAAMLLVNNPGNDHAFAPLEHAPWNGWTPTDLIFPFFLFIVGVAIPFSLSRRSANKPKLRLLGTIWYRALSIFLLGALLQAIPFRMDQLPDGFQTLRMLRVIAWIYTIGAIALVLYPWKRSVIWAAIVPLLAVGLVVLLIAIHHANQRAYAASLPASFNFGNGAMTPYLFRIPGVLQRIGICYGIAASIALFAGWRTCLIAAILLCAIYSTLMLKMPFKNHTTGSLTREDNLARRIDERVFKSHNYASYPDPEGLLSTLPAIASVLIGIGTGTQLRSNTPPANRAAAVLAAGVVVTLLGIALHHLLMPINKQIWTPSFTVFTAGMGMLGLGTIFYFCDVRPYQLAAGLERRSLLTTPWRIFGTNAIAAFVAAGIVTRLGYLIPVDRDPVTGQMKQSLMTFCKNAVADGLHHADAFLHSNAWLVNHLPALPTIDSLPLISLAYSLGYILVILLILSPLYFLKVFVKV